MENSSVLKSIENNNDDKKWSRLLLINKGDGVLVSKIVINIFIDMDTRLYHYEYRRPRVNPT